MAKYVIDENTLKGIGDAIRAKKGTSDPIPVPSLASEISSIESGGGGTPTTPEYNGVIPLGNYVYHANPVATLTCEIIEDEEGNPYPYWFETIDETDEVRQGFGIYITPDSTEIEASEEDYMNFYPCDNSPFKVFKEINVTEEQYNAFMQYFEFVGASAYNGVIPLGKYELATDEVIEELYLEPEPYISDDTSCFKCSVGSVSVYNFINIRADGDIIIGWYSPGEEVSLSVGDTVEVIEELEVDEETFNIFMHYFTPQ